MENNNTALRHTLIARFVDIKHVNNESGATKQGENSRYCQKFSINFFQIFHQFYIIKSINHFNDFASK
jgi:hypothetical protein